ncbi:hypothetical protein KCU83_g377, partial [Aureobasidium melanogenum]
MWLARARGDRVAGHRLRFVRQLPLPSLFHRASGVLLGLQEARMETPSGVASQISTDSPNTCSHLGTSVVAVRECTDVLVRSLIQNLVQNKQSASHAIFSGSRLTVLIECSIFKSSLGNIFAALSTTQASGRGKALIDTHVQKEKVTVPFL